ncbi:hypothetical protein [Mycobacterium sp. OAE908]|uniref:hypothetical protein n=1 Tax=Mycobacterium sp. OAE908 TaxID=2817899 RepID=UPI001AE93BEF
MIVEDVRPPTLSHRFEMTVAGEALISALVTAALIVAIVCNLPDSDIKRSAQPALRPLAVSTGTDQTWTMYSPDPIRRIEILEVHVTMADGSDRMWSFSQGDRVIGQLHWYHWQKLKEQVIRTPAIRAGLAMWAVRHLTTLGEHPTKVQMILRTEELLPPGKAGVPTVGTEVLYAKTLNGWR